MTDKGPFASRTMHRGILVVRDRLYFNSVYEE